MTNVHRRPDLRGPRHPTPTLSTKATGPTYSPDWRWVSVGTHWQPVSADGTRRWNGFEWVPIPRPPGTYRLGVTSIACGIAALVAIPACPVAALVGMTWGVATYSIFGSVTFLLGLSAGIVAIVAGSRGLEQLGPWRGTRSGREMARTGRRRGIAALCLLPILLLVLVIMADS